MRVFRLHQFDLSHLTPDNAESPAPGPGQVALDVRALSLNYRDLLIIRGVYNPKLRLPAVPVSDGAGVVSAIGPDVTRVRVGDPVMTHFVADWIDGPFRAEYTRSTLGIPGPGLAAERVVLPADAVLPIPNGYDFAMAATLPIAALTAWSVLVNVAAVQPGQTIVTLGTGGVSIFATQIAKTLGARVIITSRSDEKLARARALGADHGVNYRTTPNWDAQVLELTGGAGADVIVENGGAGTLGASLRAARAGGIIGLLGALTGLRGEVTTGMILMKRLHIAGIMVDSRAAFEKLVEFIERTSLRPVIDRTFEFEQLPDALRYLESGAHFGKIVLRVGA